MSLKILANLIGITAVVLCVLCFQSRTRRGILFLNASSRVFYVLQYILLGAFAGAVLDLTALLVTILARHKDNRWLKKHPGLMILGANGFVVAMGLLSYENGYSLLPIIGVLFETGAFWLNRERNIRLVSFASIPFWLAYNLICGAYGSVLGNVLTAGSIGLAIFRYDILKKKQKRNEKE